MDEKQGPSLRGYSIHVLGITVPTALLALFAFGPTGALGALLGALLALAPKLLRQRSGRSLLATIGVGVFIGMAGGLLLAGVLRGPDRLGDGPNMANVNKAIDRSTADERPAAEPEAISTVDTAPEVAEQVNLVAQATEYHIRIEPSDSDWMRFSVSECLKLDLLPNQPCDWISTRDGSIPEVITAMRRRLAIVPSIWEVDRDAPTSLMINVPRVGPVRVEPCLTECPDPILHLKLPFSALWANDGRTYDPHRGEFSWTHTAAGTFDNRVVIAFVPAPYYTFRPVADRVIEQDSASGIMLAMVVVILGLIGTQLLELLFELVKHLLTERVLRPKGAGGAK
jgi:hypothetical protein